MHVLHDSGPTNLAYNCLICVMQYDQLYTTSRSSIYTGKRVNTDKRNYNRFNRKVDKLSQSPMQLSFFAVSLSLSLSLSLFSQSFFLFISLLSMYFYRLYTLYQYCHIQPGRAVLVYSIPYIIICAESKNKRVNL